MQEYLGDNLVFIVGCPRSGTTWLRKLLSSHPSVRSGKESYLFAWYLGPQLRRWHKDKEIAVKSGEHAIGMSTYLKDSDFLSALREYMENLITPMAKDLEDGEILVEKTPEHALYIKEIAELLPKCKFVHILRDGRDVVSSLLAVSKQPWAYWAPHSSRKAATMWASYVQTARASLKSLPSNRFCELRYENLALKTKETLIPLFAFMGLEWKDENISNGIRRLNSHIPTQQKQGFSKKAGPGGWKKQLSMPQKLLVWVQIHKLMNELGYVWKYPW